MTDREHLEEERTHDSGIRNADHGTGSDAHELPVAERDHSADAESHDAEGHYVDPAEAVMNSNPNLSPPIHVRP
jgi:hypothetical protein